jgi:hypothetical protein
VHWHDFKEGAQGIKQRFLVLKTGVQAVKGCLLGMKMRAQKRQI